MHKDENGYIVVETIFSFTLLVLLILSILSLVNVVAAQNRMHFALTQTAQELSMYSYILQVTGIADELKEIDTNAAEFEEQRANLMDNVKAMIGGLGDLQNADNLADAYGSAENISGAAQAATEQGEAWLEDPEGTLALLIDYGLNYAVDTAAGYIISPLFKKYLASDALDADTVIASLNIAEGIHADNFNGSKLLDADGNITLKITYRIQYSFGALPLPFSALRTEQSVQTRAWLDGNGEGYDE